MLLQDILDAAKEDMANDNTDKLVSELEFEEDQDYYESLGPRAFGPDLDDEESL
jgi:hypothetical protein